MRHSSTVKPLVLTAALGAALALPAAGAAADAEGPGDHPKRVVMHFADLGGIRDWQAVSTKELIVEGYNGKKYNVTLYGSCLGLPFTETIGFVTDATGDLDKFSSIYVDGQRCYFKTFTLLEDEENDSDD